jgi:hypothetical protein
MDGVVFIKINMKLRFYLSIFISVALLSGIIASCAPAPQVPIPLASFKQNDVDVSISLDGNSTGNYSLFATFMPPPGYHLYSKDIPINGASGMGRPTLLELVPNSHLKALGSLTESVSAGLLAYGPPGLLIYPAGAVTLSLPVELPSGKQWVDDQVRLTYMVCSETQCKPPVEGKIVSVRIPGANMFDH